MQAHLTLRADADALEAVEGFVSAFVQEHGIEGDDEGRICIVLEELLTNLVKYGYADASAPGMVDIGLTLEGNRLTIEFSDDGQPFDPLAQPAPDLDAATEEREIGGLGIHILRSLADEADYSRRGGRNVIRLVRRVSVDR
jgi:anti-sigma regulatory factor (Ser/Thr protein kinase)